VTEPTKTGQYQRISEVFKQLSRNQLRFVVAMQDHKTKTDAAKALRIPVRTVYNWPHYVDEAIEYVQRDIANSAIAMRKQALVKAMAVKINALESKDERVQQAAASEIIEAELAKIEAGLGDELESLFRLPADTISGSFFDAYRDIQAHKHTEYVFKGGRGSTKSSFVSEVIIELLINNSDWHVLVTRQVANTLRDSVYSQLVWAINYLGLSDRFKCTTSPLEITYIPTDQKIYFRGGDDPLKIKSIKPRFGYINILWFEELDQFRGAAEVRSIVQSALRGGDQAYIFKSYNPPRSRSNWVNKQLEIPKDNRYIHESDYRSVPAEWLGQAFIDEAMFLKDVNPPAYEHEYLGIATAVGGLVFENVEIREITDDEIAEFDRITDGLDFGYYPDPAHWNRMHYDAARLTLYIYDEYRGWKHSNQQLYDMLTGHKGVLPNDAIIADSAEPKSIADLRTWGLAIRGAEKGPGSVDYSMKWLQSLRKIVIDNRRCPHTADEFLNYEYEQTKDGEYISSYPDRDDHAIAAVRYGTNLIWRRRGQ
jgi:PBSX family phage terminase large subunit